MAVINTSKAVNDYLLTVGQEAMAAALSASTVAGTKLKIEIVTDEDVLPMIEILETIGEANAFVAGDAMVGRKANDNGTPIIEVLIGVDATMSDLGWNCGACGFPTCAEYNKFSKENRSQGVFYAGPNCNWKVLDFGIACSTAAAAVSAANVECRVQDSYGFAALALGYVSGASICTAVSIGPVKESPWFDRVDLKHSFTMQEHEQFVKNTLPQLYQSFCGGGHPMIKHSENWATEPRFWSESENPEFIEKQENIKIRVGEIIKREQEKKSSA